jgi:hypothetical protein
MKLFVALTHHKKAVRNLTRKIHSIKQEYADFAV